MNILKNKYGQILIDVEDQIDLNLDDVIWATQTVLRLEEFGIRVIVDLEKGYVNLSPEALTYLSGHTIQSRISGVAIVLRSLSNRLLANAFVKNNKFQYPARVFENRAEAEDWLLY